MASTAEKHASLLSVCKQNKAHRRLKLLRSKYRFYKEEDSYIKANEVRQQIKALRTYKLVLGDEDDETE